MRKFTATLLAASLLIGLAGLGAAHAASKKSSRTHHSRTTRHHYTTRTHRSRRTGMSSSGMRRSRSTRGTTNITIGNANGTLGNTAGGANTGGTTTGGTTTGRRHGRGVNGGVFSPPTVSNNGQAAPSTPPSGVNGTGTDKAGGAGSTR